VSGGIVAMSEAERERAHVVRRIVSGEVTQVRAGELLGITPRQVGRLVAAYRARGDRGLVSGKRGKASNNRRSAAESSRIVAALKERYADFGATLAAEKLRSHEGLIVSRESVRQLQIAHGLWRPKMRKAKRVFQVRERRARFGELIQIDGSHHDWFEGRAPKCALLVFIDDATGRLTGLRFAPAETTHDYLCLLREHVTSHGLPLALYSDRHGVFRVNAKDIETGDGKTVFNRVTDRLAIEQICATTPQAKGRVERVNKTLQDRLVKEMRLAGISDIAAAQAFLADYIKGFNAQFACEPRDLSDAHRAWTAGTAALDAALAEHQERRLSKALTFSTDGTLYCVNTGPTAGIALRGSKVVVRHYLDGRMDVLHKSRLLAVTRVRGVPRPSALADDKTLDARVDVIAARVRGRSERPGAVDGAA
jgi:predicted transcriptional regulator